MADQVFMSHAREDQDFALKLAGVLKAQGVPVWLDQRELWGGARWEKEVEEAVCRSSHLLVVLSPASSASVEVHTEWRLALDEGIPVIPLLFEECRILPRLRLLNYIDFTSRAPNDATAVGEIVRALGMEERDAEKQERVVISGKVAQNWRDSTMPSTQNADRAELVNSLHWDLSRLPPEIFRKLVFQLGAMGRGYTCEGGPGPCAMALIEWADGPAGCGLEELRRTLDRAIL